MAKLSQSSVSWTVCSQQLGLLTKQQDDFCNDYSCNCMTLPQICSPEEVRKRNQLCGILGGFFPSSSTHGCLSISSVEWPERLAGCAPASWLDVRYSEHLRYTVLQLLPQLVELKTEHQITISTICSGILKSILWTSLFQKHVVVSFSANLTQCTTHK